MNVHSRQSAQSSKPARRWMESLIRAGGVDLNYVLYLIWYHHYIKSLTFRGNDLKASWKAAVYNFTRLRKLKCFTIRFLMQLSSKHDKI